MVADGAHVNHLAGMFASTDSKATIMLCLLLDNACILVRFNLPNGKGTAH